MTHPHPRCTLAFELALAVLLFACSANAQDAPVQGPEKPADAKPTVDGKTAAQWIKHLSHEDQEERTLATDKLLQFEEPPIVEIVAAQVEGKEYERRFQDHSVREHDTLDGLEEVVIEFDLDALPGLLKLLDSKDDATRACSAHFLGKLALAGANDWKTVGPLRKLLDDKRDFVRQSAAWALGEIAGLDAKESQPDLERVLKNDTDLIVRMNSAMALWKITSSLDAAEGGNPSPPVPEIMIKALASEDPFMRSCAARSLALLGEKGTPAKPEIEKLLKEKDPYVQLAGAVAFWDITADPAPALPVLVKLLDAKEASVREVAALVLGEMEGDAKSAAVPLRKLAEEDPSRRVRSAARDSAQRIREATPEPKPET